jgi:TetR/AcrR family transcriptional repressor of qacA
MNENEKGKRDKLDRLFEAATERFGEDGYNETTMESIAEEAGVSKGTLYYYFDSKEELFLELFRDWLKKFEQLWEEEDFEDSPVRELVHLHTSMMKTVEETASLGRLMLEFWANASRKKKLEEILNETLKEYRAKTAEIIEKGEEKGVFREVDSWQASSALVAAYDGLWFHWLLDPEAFALEEAGEKLVTNFIRGLGKKDFELEAVEGGDERR